MAETRRLPNVIITGTPGVGKSVHCQQLVQELTDLKVMPINDIVKEKECHDGWDDERDCWIVDEDKVLQDSDIFHPSASNVHTSSLSCNRR